MAIVSGINVTIGGFSCLANFEVKNIGIDNGIACSNSAGKIIRSATAKDWQATCRGYGSTAPVSPGGGVTISHNGAGGTGIVDWIEVICNTENPKEVIQWSVHCVACNTPATPAVIVPAGTVTNPPSVVGQGVGSGGGNWRLRAMMHLTGPVWLSASTWPERSIGYTDAIAEYEWYYDVGSNSLPSAGQAAAVTLGGYTVTGICTVADTNVVVHNRSNQPEYQKCSGTIMGTLT